MHVDGRRYDNGKPIRVEISGGKSAAVGEHAAPSAAAAALPWIAPGLIDIQLNGYAGQEFSSPELTVAKVAEIACAVDRFGVTRFLPTLTTERHEVLDHALRTIAAACEGSAEVARRVAGVHLEGPYISAEDGVRGAHPRAYCRRPDWDEFQRLQEAAGGRVRLMTLAAEYDESPALIRRLVAAGVVAAIGHTAADADQIRAAVDAGARLSTHLGNGCHPLLPRHPNYLWDQLAEDRLMAGLICDGHHLPPAVVKTFVRAKTPARCLLVSDMAGQAGLAPGRYPGGLCEVEVLPGGRLVMAGQDELMAGASEPIGTGVANVIAYAGVSLAEAVAMAVDQPAHLLGLPTGGLRAGEPADLVLFDLIEPRDGHGPKFHVRATILGGEVVYGQAGAC